MAGVRFLPIRLLIIALTPCLLAGCQTNKVNTTPSGDPQLSETTTASEGAPALAADDSFFGSRTASSNPGGESGGAVHMQFDVYRVELPMDEERLSLRIWKHLNEAMGDPQKTALLARNGLRVGKGDRDAWPAMRTILEQAGGRMGTYRHVVDNGVSLIINLDQADGGESYFVHGRGGSLRGGALPPGTMRLLVDYAVQENQTQSVLLRVKPELQEARTRTRYVEQGGNVAEVQDHEGVTFDELTVAIKLGPEEFFVMGGSEQADSGYLIGSRWLSSMLGMKKHETVLFIRPQLVRVK